MFRPARQAEKKSGMAVSTFTSISHASVSIRGIPGGGGGGVKPRCFATDIRVESDA
jgi:hypothetical protein